MRLRSSALARHPDLRDVSRGPAAAFGRSDAAAIEPAGGDIPLLAPGDPRVDPRIATAFAGRSDMATQVRDLRSALSSRWHADAPDVRRSVALVGADPAADVATVAANLAVASAQFGWRTLLVDGDLAAPAQHRLFRLPGDAGLSTLLLQRAPAELQPTAIERLSLLAAGPAPASPTELIERQPLLDALDGVLARQRLVLLSLPMRGQPPRFGAIDTILSGFDGALTVASRHRSALGALQRLVEMLEEGGVPLLGTVVV
ncbi:hypothetical protein ACBY01_06845 [Sphingomonas sp. ac-8]|uniref:hypothetical protein n=1 Tax=Sphingomonas sp. ac-8 TaxID=3242977 RepID=UPI003A80476A